MGSVQENRESFPHPDIHNLSSGEDEVWGGQEEDERDKRQQNLGFLSINPIFARTDHTGMVFNS